MTTNTGSTQPQTSSNTPANFIQSGSVAHVHPALVPNCSVQYIADLGQFGSQEDIDVLARLRLWDGADEEKERLFVTMEKYERKAKKKHQTCRSLNEIRDAQQSWKDILGEADAALDSHKDKNIAVKYIRKLRDNLSYFEGWTALLPQGDYSAAIGIGFKMALTAASRMKSVDDMLFEVLGKIPEYLGNAERYQNIYRSSRNPKLVRKTAELYVSIVVALTAVFEYLRENSLVAGGKALFLGNSYKKNLETKLTAVRDATDAVKAEAELSLHETHALGLQDQFFNENQRRQDVVEQKTDIKELRDKVDSMTEAMKEATTLLKNSLKATHVNLSSSQFLDPVTSTLLQIPYQQVSRSPSPMSSTIHRVIRAKDILRRLRYNPETVENDLVYQLQLGGSLELSQQARLSDLVKSSRLKEWLQSTTSDLIFIHGNSSNDDIGAVLSFFSAKLLASFQNADPVITIHYFCNSYLDEYAEVGGHSIDAASMMCSLLSQLLSQDKFDFDLSSITEHDLSGLEERSLKTACVLFARLLKQLPPATALILVIDDISRLEDAQRYHDTKKAINHITHLMQQALKEGNVVFKVLITSSCACRLWRECSISEDHEIFLEEDLVDDDGQGFEEETMDADMAF